MDEASMYLYGYEAGQADQADGTYSAPIEAEDGADYVRGYLDGFAA